MKKERKEITKRERAEELLRTGEERIRTILDNAAEAVENSSLIGAVEEV